jgi:hypothetical protein
MKKIILILLAVCSISCTKQNHCMKCDLIYPDGRTKQTVWCGDPAHQFTDGNINLSSYCR